MSSGCCDGCCAECHQIALVTVSIVDWGHLADSPVPPL